MSILYEGLHLDQEQTMWLCRGLLDLAAVDGVHPNEVALIEEFYRSNAGEAIDLEGIRAAGFDPHEAAAVIQGDLVDAFLMSCYMLIYADGIHSDEERARIAEFAAVFGASEERLEEIHVRARMYLLRMLAVGLKNRQVLSAVGANLGLAPQNIAEISALED